MLRPTVRRARHALPTVVLPLLVAGSAATAHAQDRRAVLVEGTGTYSRSISTESELAQRFFDQGLRLVHGYHFSEASASFLEASCHDSHPMIYWGLALAAGPNPNSRAGGFPDDPTGEGRKAIEKARELAERATQKERAFIDALFVRYDAATHPDRAVRDTAYAEAARRLVEEYPDDPDAGALLADALMTLSPWDYWTDDGSPRPNAREASAVLERVMERRPEHPWANHLYIHLHEASPEPERALPQADRLAALMPKVGHVVHMPSHVYLRVGDYARAITMNERSAAADEAFLEAWGDLPYPGIVTYPISARVHPGHAHEFIWYASTLQGNYGRAIESVRSTKEIAVEGMGLESGRAQRAAAGVWLVHKIFGRWEALLAEPGPPAEGFPYLEGMWHYARGSAFAARGNLDRAREELARLRAAAGDPEIEDLRVVKNLAPRVLQVAVHGLEGEIAQAEGQLDEAVAAFEAAVRAEDALGYVEPPDWPQPMRLYLGAALLAADRPAEAEPVYREELAWNRGSGWALYGLWRSLEAQGRGEEADRARDQFRGAWRNADVELPAVPAGQVSPEVDTGELLRERKLSLPPYRFEDVGYVGVVFETSDEAVRRLVPEPLKPEGALVRATFLDYGAAIQVGTDVRFPYREFVLAVPVRYGGVRGDYHPVLYLDRGRPIYTGREVFGYPKLLARLEYRTGPDSTVAFARGPDGLVARLAFRPTGPGQATPLTRSINLKLIPSVEEGAPPEVKQLTVVDYSSVRTREVENGAAEFELGPAVEDLLGPIPVRRIVGAQRGSMEFEQGFGRVLHDYLASDPGRR